VKEAVFNILGHRFGTPGGLPGLAVLDLFCGPGSLGIEAISRGARSCVFVEHDRRTVRSLRQNIETLQLAEVSSILTDNAWTMRPPRPSDGFGLVFVDPPYPDARDPVPVTDLLERLAPSLAADGLIVFRQEASGRVPPVEQLPGLRFVDQRVFGRMRVLFLARQEGSAEL
jgi:16S rRNA (guanine966-N2)-methyltransferase